MHSQARAFLQPTRANIHQYQFNKPIILSSLSLFSQKKKHDVVQTRNIH